MCWSPTSGICRALVLASMEVKFHVDPDTDTVVDIVAKQHLETMSMVEEFMLLANVTSAECTLKVKNCLKTAFIVSEVTSLQHETKICFLTLPKMLILCFDTEENTLLPFFIFSSPLLQKQPVL